MCVKIWGKSGIVQAGAKEQKRRALDLVRVDVDFAQIGWKSDICGALLLHFAFALAQGKFTSTSLSQCSRQGRVDPSCQCKKSCFRGPGLVPQDECFVLRAYLFPTP